MKATGKWQRAEGARREEIFCYLPSAICKSLRCLHILALALPLACLVRGGDSLPAQNLTRNAIILVLDGERYTETWGDPEHKYIQRLAEELAPQGVILTQFRNNFLTLTNPGHAALCTGHYQELPNDVQQGLWSNPLQKNSLLPAQPSIFQVFRKETGAPASATWVITSKDKLQILANCRAPEWRGQYMPSTFCGVGGQGYGSGYADDSATMENTLKILGRDHPRLAIINLKDPDACGHANDWNGYLKAIRTCDDFAAQLWRFIQKDEVYANKTALFITSDHGRHTASFINHGCNCEGCRHICCCALGPDFKKGAVSDTPAEQIDVAPTIATLLHFPLPTAQGRVLTELFANAVEP